MSSTQTVVVFGATGAQGGSVVRELQAAGKYNIRAVTRNPSSEAAQALSKQGVQVVSGDANDVSSLHSSIQRRIGFKKLVDAAVEAKTVKFIVWSSLHDVDSVAKGSLVVGHFTNKNKVEQYIRNETSLQAAFVYPGFYMQNWVYFPPFGVPTRKGDKVVLDTAVRADVALPLIDIEQDFGKFVAPLFADPSKFNGTKILAASEYLTVPQMADAFTAVTGEKVTFGHIPVSAVPVAELQATIKLFNAYGYYLGEFLEPTRELIPNLPGKGSFEAWLKRVNYQAHQA
ncbi:hypothetical protein EMMF5_004682 [Cystobasidiomycetes sp. EMM_F5]